MRDIRKKVDVSWDITHNLCDLARRHFYTGFGKIMHRIAAINYIVNASPDDFKTPLPKIINGTSEVDLKIFSTGLIRQMNTIAQDYNVSLEHLINVAAIKIVDDPHAVAKIKLFKGMRDSGLSLLSESLKTNPELLCKFNDGILDKDGIRDLMATLTEKKRTYSGEKISIVLDQNLHERLMEVCQPFYKTGCYRRGYTAAIKLYAEAIRQSDFDAMPKYEVQSKVISGKVITLNMLTTEQIRIVNDIATKYDVTLHQVVSVAVKKMVDDTDLPGKMQQFKGLHTSNLVKRLDNKIGEGKELPKETKPTLPARQKATPAIISAVVDLSYRQEKFKVRSWLLGEIKKNWTGNSISALTLPGSEWLFERDLLILKPESRIIGLEANKQMFDYAAANIPPSYRVHHFHQTDKEYFEGPSNNLDVVWLDYMGQFMPQRLDVFENMLSKGHLSSKCMFAVTFLKGRDGAAVELYKQYGEPGTRQGKYNELRKIAIPDLYRKVALKHGYDLDVLRVEEYQEKQGDVARSPMMFFVFMLKKQEGIPTDLAARKATIYKTLHEGKEVTDTLGFTKYQIAGFRAALTRKAPVTQLAGFRVATTRKAPVTQQGKNL